MLMLSMTGVKTCERSQHDSITIFRWLVFFKKYPLPTLPIKCLQDTEFLWLDSVKTNKINVAALAISLASNITKYCDKLTGIALDNLPNSRKRFLLARG